MKKCDEPNSHMSSELPSIYISSYNDRHPVPKTVDPIHYTSLHFTTRADTSLLPI